MDKLHLKYSIWFIICIKILFIIFELLYIFDLRNDIINYIVIYWKVKLRWIFNILMLLVLIHIFYPWKNDMATLTREIRHLLFIYAILSLITTLWTNFL